MADFIGPDLPPEFKKESSNRDTDSDGKDLIGPTLPTGGPAAICGPMLPPNEEERAAPVKDNSRYGPQLPPDVEPRTSSYGPALPPGFQCHTSPEVVGPAFPPAVVGGPVVEDTDEDVIGPQPLPAGAKETYELERSKREIELRSKATKDRLTGKVKPSEPEVQKREEWMTELPPEMKPSGIGARTFRKTNFDPGDRSVWTDTPADIIRKAQQGVQKEKQKDSLCPEGSSKRDRELREHVLAHNKTHRSQSLMEMHRKRRAEECDDKGTERRPFDRDTDLELPRNLVTPAKRQALMKDSAKALSNKFAHGKQAFL